MSPIREKFVSIIESLPYNIDEEALQILATEYAKARNFDVDMCVESVLKMRWHKHKQR